MFVIAVLNAETSSAVSDVTLLRYRSTARLVLLSGWLPPAAATGRLLDTVTFCTIRRRAA